MSTLPQPSRAAWRRLAADPAVAGLRADLAAYREALDASIGAGRGAPEDEYRALARKADMLAAQIVGNAASLIGEIDRQAGAR